MPMTKKYAIGPATKRQSGVATTEAKSRQADAARSLKREDFKRRSGVQSHSSRACPLPQDEYALLLSARRVPVVRCGCLLMGAYGGCLVGEKEAVRWRGTIRTGSSRTLRRMSANGGWKTRFPKSLSVRNNSVRRVRRAERLGTGRDGMWRGRRWSASSLPRRLWQVWSPSLGAENPPRPSALGPRRRGPRPAAPARRGGWAMSP